MSFPERGPAGGRLVIATLAAVAVAAVAGVWAALTDTFEPSEAPTPAGPKVLVAIVALALVMLLEGLVPRIADAGRDWRHDRRNLLLGAVAALPALLGLSALTAGVAAAAAARGWGLLHLVELPAPVAALVAVVALDLWMYAWHRANHQLAALWRLHRVHHADSALDGSSAFRFHVLEVALGGLLRLGVVVLAGASFAHVLLYDLVLLPVIVFHHGSLYLPPRLDRLLRTVVVTPAIHHVHHSRRREETDSNYASVLSAWDRLAGTLRLRDPREISFGVDGWDDLDRGPWWRLLSAPWRRSGGGASADEPR